MSRSVDESRYANRWFRSSSDPWHTNFSLAYDQPMNVAQQSLYEYPFTVSSMSQGRTSSCSMQIPDSAVPCAASFPSVPDNYPYVSCQSRLTDKPWYQYQKSELGGGTSCYALSTRTDSRSFVVDNGGQPQVSVPTLPSSPVDCGLSQCCVGADTDCGNNAQLENNSGMPITDPSKASCSSNCTDFVVSSVGTSTNVASAVDSKTDVLTPASTTEVTTVTASAGAVTPRPKCGRAKTNAELKRQLMERREQRLRDMLESGGSESIATSHACAIVVSASACKPTEPVVSYCTHYFIIFTVSFYEYLLLCLSLWVRQSGDQSCLNYQNFKVHSKLGNNKSVCMIVCTVCHSFEEHS